MAISLKAKISAATAVIVFPAFMLLGLWAGSEVEKYVALEASRGLMNFADAKQQGVIRYLAQNRKLAQSLLDVSETMSPEALRKFFLSLKERDVFDIEDHKYKDEIKAGDRKIPAWNVYHRIDYVRNGVIVVSSDPSVERTAPAPSPESIKNGYTSIYKNGNEYWLTVSAGSRDRAILLHTNGGMLGNIVSGEIGNLEKGFSYYYLAGVGKTFDYYITDADNTLLTASRTKGEGSILRDKGSLEPWRISTGRAKEIPCSNEVYVTNVGAKTFCRETMGFYESAGHKMLGASMPFYDSSWTLVVEQRADELFAPFRELMQRLLYVLLGAAFVTFALLQYIISRIVKRSLRVKI